jgi:Flp pilus assembly protein TadG
MNGWLDRFLGRAPGPRRVVLGWRRDEAGASLVQFIVVLPVFVLIVVGLWAMFQVYSAHQTLCEAVWEASRYLQVEGPYFPETIPYPAGWEQKAADIINTELKSNAAINIAPVAVSSVTVSPNIIRKSPEDTTQVNEEAVTNAWFFVKATTTITNPLALFVPGTGPGGALTLTCKGTGFFEGQPIGPTNPQEGQKCPDIPPGNQCTRVPPGRPTPEPTPCDRGDPFCGCPVCRPR